MDASLIIFYCIAAFILGAAFLAVTSAKIFRSAIWLLFSLIGIAALYYWMDVQFIAAVQTIVYVGGIVVLIIFSIFLTHNANDNMPKPPVMRQVFAGLASLFGIALVLHLVYHHSFTTPTGAALNGDVANIGTLLISTEKGGYALPFELASILLLAAMIGCIVIAMRKGSANVNSVE